MASSRFCSALTVLALCVLPESNSMSLSSFNGNSIFPSSLCPPVRKSKNGVACLTMRKQKASDRRTRRMQRGQSDDISSDTSIRSIVDRMRLQAPVSTLTSAPMSTAAWRHKSVPLQMRKAKTSGRGRSRKRATLYSYLASYQNKFLEMLTDEYQIEEDEVLSRINGSIEDPLGLEATGYAIFDLYPERRGNLFSDEVYRLVKARDATTTYSLPKSRQTVSPEKVCEPEDDAPPKNGLPPNHKFASNDVVMLTLQPNGSGDFFDKTSLPTNNAAVAVEARVLSTGPTYVDVALPGGAFEATFGPAPNNVGPSGKGNPRVRLRADRFFSNIPYTRMVAALSQITSIPDRSRATTLKASGAEEKGETNPYGQIHMDELLRETILSTYAFTDPSSMLFRDTDACNLRELARMLAKPPIPNSSKLANQVLGYIESNPHRFFNEFNSPQMTAIQAALTRRLTLIQGPPGTGKTTVAATICFGFVHQCRSISTNTKVLACAFSNVGADNMAEQLLRLGLKVVRVGKPSAISKSLWGNTLDAAIDKDPDAQEALKSAALASAQLVKYHPKRMGDSSNTRRDRLLRDRTMRDAATAAVKASIKASNVAATKALRKADVIVCTSIGAADSRLLAACGVVSDDENLGQDSRLNSSTTKKEARVTEFSELSPGKGQHTRQDAPDGLPPLSLPFVVVDEACQSVEPANLIPLTATDSCRSLVLLGDPCQLPPTVRSDSSLPLSLSLMERLSATLPHPVIVAAKTDQTPKDDSYLNCKPTRQAISLLRYAEGGGERRVAYRKRFAGSLLLSVQYRMHSSISSFSSAVFYDGLLATPAFINNPRKFPAHLNAFLPTKEPGVGVRFIDVGGRNNERRSSLTQYSSSHAGVDGLGNPSLQQTSYWNRPEAEQVVETLKAVLKGQDPTKNIGVVTPYNGQVELIKSLLSSDEEFELLSRNLQVPVEVKSVDGYQGRERDTIIFSTVRSNRQANVGFLSDWRRMNVALTRAKSALVVVGDFDTLTAGDKHWDAFGKWCTGHGCIVQDGIVNEAPPLS